MSENRLVLPVANPETADRLLDTALDVARDRDLELLVVHVVEVPMQLSLVYAREELDTESGESVVSDTVERAQASGVDATGLIRFGRDVARSLVNMADSSDVEAILLGWRGRPRRRNIVLGSYIDTVLGEADCDVLVKRIDRDGGPVESILVPVAGGPHTEYAGQIAGSVARGHDATVELVTVIPPAATTEETEAARDLLTRISPELGAVDSVTETVLRNDDVVEAIVERADDHDVTVLGAARGGLVRRVLVGDVPESVGRRADSAVIMCRRYEGLSRTLWRRVKKAGW
ncbi:universal stress protein [Halovivax gelatinilyticus]|uniref:universal stress protein n=1 Tax=Halovivax gelatinilyticus TaxID=2961597 RepID=UPI0020CA4B7D|nr:universal stress protein [Halovivax gelatinilyticus]